MKYQYDDGRYAAMGQGLCTRPFLTEDVSKAVVFDGRDNEEMKLGYYGARLGVKLDVEIIPQIVCAP